MKKKATATLICMGLVSCSLSSRTVFTLDEIRGSDYCLTETHVVLSFSVDNSDGTSCPGVNVVQRNKRLDVEFVRMRQGEQTPKVDIPVAKDPSAPDLLMVEIPYSIHEQGEVEVFINGTKSIGKWSTPEDS